MPVAFRSLGPRLKVDIASAPAQQSVAMPPGHAAGDLLLLVLVYDSNTGPTIEPSGWTRLGDAGAGLSTPWANASQVQTRLYYRMATGTVPAASFTFPRNAWPTGSPYVLAFTVAYSGADPAGPIEKWGATGTANTAASQVHPRLTTVADGDWLLTLRTGSAWGARTTSIAGGTNTKRLDDNDGLGELYVGLYDSGAPLAPGLQAQRSTQSAGGSVVSQGGSTMWSLALKTTTPVNSTVALPGTATVAATALGAGVDAEPGGWDLCGPDGLPTYRFAIDWDADGTIGSRTAVGAVYAADSFTRSTVGGWGVADTGQAWSTGALSSNFSVDGGAGLHAVSARGVSRFSLVPADSADVDLRTDYTTDQDGVADSLYVQLVARYTDADNLYFARVQMASTGEVTVTLRKRVGGTETVLATASPGLAHAAGVVYCARMRLRGPLLLAKVWPVGTPEPAEWQVSATDADLVAPGSVGLRSVVGSGTTNTLPVTFVYDNFTASHLSDPEDVTGDIVSDVSVSYGRDQDRQLSPAAIGSASFTLDNSHRRYSPENVSGPLYGELDPARSMSATVSFNGQRLPLFAGRIDDFNVRADFADRTAEFTFLDGLSDLSGSTLSTDVFVSRRTGELLHEVLDRAGWTGGRDIDPGATVVRYWWLDGADALSAVNDLVASEGPPAVAYVAPDGTFVFRDRHHRLQRPVSRAVQATFTAGRLGECADGPAPVAGYDYTAPFVYAHGWRDVVNTVAFDVEERGPGESLEVVWTDESTRVLEAGQSLDLTINVTDPFVGAITPQPGTDVPYTSPGVGRLETLLSRDSGTSARLTLSAVGGPVTVTGARLRARSLTVQRTVRVSVSDPGSVSRHGVRTYPESAPWASPEDAEAIASMVLLHYARRRPTVQLRIVGQDPAHFMQVLQRTVSDRIRVVNDEMGLDDDFFVERVTHTVQRVGRPGHAPVHSVVLGCEQDLVINTNPFTFDQRGSGFDQGAFDLTAVDDPDEVFTFDDPVQGVFDRGRLGT